MEILPVKEGLLALTLEPMSVIELQVVTIPMSRVNLREWKRLLLEVNPSLNLEGRRMCKFNFSNLQPQANAARQVYAPSHLLTDPSLPKEQVRGSLDWMNNLINNAVSKESNMCIHIYLCSSGCCSGPA